MPAPSIVQSELCKECLFHPVNEQENSLTFTAVWSTTLVETNEIRRMVRKPFGIVCQGELFNACELCVLPSQTIGFVKSMSVLRK